MEPRLAAHTDCYGFTKFACSVQASIWNLGWQRILTVMVLQNFLVLFKQALDVPYACAKGRSSWKSGRFDVLLDGIPSVVGSSYVLLPGNSEPAKFCIDVCCRYRKPVSVVAGVLIVTSPVVDVGVRCWEGVSGDADVSPCLVSLDSSCGVFDPDALSSLPSVSK
ncbi:hypothetical protein Tco_1082317 [Tanacetum coccineum]|uniref:Uncharacterized protein n=1 Tax=Tanacetum coccineum TaxID=301880 RepID=A0ABQ5I278_9ASTR